MIPLQLKLVAGGLMLAVILAGVYYVRALRAENASLKADVELFQVANNALSRDLEAQHHRAERNGALLVGVERENRRLSNQLITTRSEVANAYRQADDACANRRPPVAVLDLLRRPITAAGGVQADPSPSAAPAGGTGTAPDPAGGDLSGRGGVRARPEGMGRPVSGEAGSAEAMAGVRS